MSVTVYSRNRDDELTGVRYVAGYAYTYGQNHTHVIEIPAVVSAEFGKGSLALEIADARALMEGIAVALVEHAVAVKVSAIESKAVA